MGLSVTRAGAVAGLATGNEKLRSPAALAVLLQTGESALDASLRTGDVAEGVRELLTAVRNLREKVANSLPTSQQLFATNEYGALVQGVETFCVDLNQSDFNSATGESLASMNDTVARLGRQTDAIRQGLVA